jgi:hypothetical protein
MSFHAALALFTAALTAAPLGTPLRQDGYVLRPPEGFRMTRMQPFHGTRVGAVPGAQQGPRYLSAALVDAEGPHAASLLVSVVGGSFRALPSTRDGFATATVRHFADELGVPLALERAEFVRHGTQRIEVLGTVRQQDQLRRVLVAALEGEGRHVVVTFTAPSARFEALLPQVRASLDSHRADDPPGSVISRSVAGALAASSLLLLFVSWSLWRRRAQRRLEQGGRG